MEHLNKVHAAQLEEAGLDAAQACYLTTHTSLHGRCTCCDECQELTEWCYKTGKPYRISPKPECRARNTQRARERLMAARGIDQHTLMTDMQHQKDLRRKKHTSGIYRFETDGGKVEYESQLDKNFLMFVDKILEMPSFTIMDSPECFPYMDTKTNTERFYTPDYYLPDYNLLVEIKEGGKSPNTNPAYIEETKYKVALKDAAMKKQDKYNFIRISGANYGPFIEMLYNITHQQVDDEKPKHVMVVITESACTDPEENFNVDIDDEVINVDNIRLIVGYATTGSWIPLFIGITDSTHYAKWYLSDYTTNTIYQTDYNDPIFQTAVLRLYRYIGNAEIMQAVFKLICNYAAGTEHYEMVDILEILGASAIYFDDGKTLSNNHHRKSDFIEMEAQEGGQ